MAIWITLIYGLLAVIAFFVLSSKVNNYFEAIHGEGQLMAKLPARVAMVCMLFVLYFIGHGIWLLSVYLFGEPK